MFKKTNRSKQIKRRNMQISTAALVFLCGLYLLSAQLVNLMDGPVQGTVFPIGSTAHAPIEITENSEMDAFFASHPGDGLSWSTAYTLTSLEIDGNDVSGCITLTNTSRYLIIEDCTFTRGAGGPWSRCGLYFKNASNVKILNSEFHDNNWAIRLSNSDYINITGNTIMNQSKYEYQDGIACWDSDFVHIEANTIDSDGDYALQLMDSEDCVIKDNLIKRATYGIEIDNTTRLEISGNDMDETGLLFSWGIYFDPVTMTVSSNTVNGKPLVWIENQASISQSSYAGAGQVFLISCSDTVVHDISVNDTSAGLSIIGCDNVNITQTLFSSNWYSVQVQESMHMKVYDNHFGVDSWNGWSSRGFFMWDCEFVDVTDNSFIGNTFGVDQKYCSSINIVDNAFAENMNTISERYGGLVLIRDNNMTDSYQNGIEMYGSSNVDVINNTIGGDTGSRGIELINVDVLEISKNLIWEFENGFLIERGESITGVNNTICASDTAISLDSLSNLNTFYNNCICGLVENAVDDGTDNSWDDGSYGNIWCGYETVYPAATNDGVIWSDAYEISGTANSLDNFPLVNKTCNCPREASSGTTDPYTPPNPDPGGFTVPSYNLYAIIGILMASIGLVVTKKKKSLKIE
mgnify:CR=1 FL=1